MPLAFSSMIPLSIRGLAGRPSRRPRRRVWQNRRRSWPSPSYGSTATVEVFGSPRELFATRHKKTLRRLAPKRAMRLATRFVAAVAASPFGIPPCPGRQVGEGNCPAQDARSDLAELSHVFKSDNNQAGACRPAARRPARPAACMRSMASGQSASLEGLSLITSANFMIMSAIAAGRSSQFRYLARAAI